ncbi:MAG: prenyltransferase, partial [Bacteroidales bacterium]|nr:prenyltransferase [Bacteroidales bacterium]
MKKLKYSLVAMRFRTLPTSLAGVALGLMLAAADYHVRWETILFLILTTICLQILANVCNELGDFLSGVDKDVKKRKGPKYTLSTGLLSPRDFKIMIAVFIALTIACGLLMIWFSFGSLLSLESL